MLVLLRKPEYFDLYVVNTIVCLFTCVYVEFAFAFPSFDGLNFAQARIVCKSSSFVVNNPDLNCVNVMRS